MGYRRYYYNRRTLQDYVPALARRQRHERLFGICLSVFLLVLFLNLL